MSINPLLNSSYTNSVPRATIQPYSDTPTSRFTSTPYSTSNNQLLPYSASNKSFGNTALGNQIAPPSLTKDGLQGMMPEFSNPIAMPENPSYQERMPELQSNMLQNPQMYPQMNSLTGPQPNPQMNPLTGPQPNPQMNPLTGPQPNPQMNPLTGPQPNPQMNPLTGPQPNPQMDSLTGPQTSPQGATDNLQQQPQGSTITEPQDQTQSNLQQGVTNNNPSVVSSSSNGGMVDGTSLEPLDGETTADDDPDDADTSPSYEDSGGVDPWQDGSDPYGTDLGQPGGATPQPIESTSGPEVPISVSGEPTSAHNPAINPSLQSAPDFKIPYSPSAQTALIGQIKSSQPTMGSETTPTTQPSLNPQIASILGNYSDTLKTLMGGNANGLEFNQQGLKPSTNIGATGASNPFSNEG